MFAKKSANALWKMPMNYKVISVAKALEYLKQGEIIAYPTEAVYGLGCDAFNKKAVEKLKQLKKRDLKKGFILLISKFEQLKPLIQDVDDELLEKVRASWPGHTTWIFPKSHTVPQWISLDGKTIAVRLSAHPVCQKLSESMVIVSTSANISGAPAIRNIEEFSDWHDLDIQGVVEGELGGAARPSEIYDVITNQQLR